MVGAATLILLGIVSYDPLVCLLYERQLDNGSAQDRKAAAEGLVLRYGASDPNRALGIFTQRVARPDAELQDACAQGLRALARNEDARGAAITQLAQGLRAADASGKVIFIRALGGVAQDAADSAKKPASDADAPSPHNAAIAEALLPCCDDAGAEIRAAATEALSSLSAPGVCARLIKLALAEKGALRESARAGIAATALPDAVPDLLGAIAGNDKEIAADARAAFARVRKQAKTETLLPLVTHAKEDVRREAVTALGQRALDSQAAKAITIALKDVSPAVRLAAVQAVPTTGLNGPATQLAELTGDADEAVRIATAQTLAQLRDGDSRAVILDGFKHNPQGKTLDAFVAALARRATGKDLAAIGVVMKLLDTTPAAEAALAQALVQLSLNGQGEARRAQRSRWSAADWKKWFAKISERESTREGIARRIDAIRKGNIDDRSRYGELKNAIEREMDQLEKCKEMCKPDDLEDVKGFDAELTQYSRVKEFFMKGASVDVRR